MKFSAIVLCSPNADFATFTEHYGKLGPAATPKQRAYLARLYWLAVEFGLVKEGHRLVTAAVASFRLRRKPCMRWKEIWPFVSGSICKRF